MNTIMRFLYASAAILAATACVSANNAPIRITCVGNSITEGGYPAILEDLLGDAYVVVNCGKNSTAVARDCDEPYCQTEEFQNVFTSSPDHITIMLGTNDTRPPMWACREQFKNDLLWLVDTFAKIQTGPKIWLCLPPPTTEDNRFDIYGSRIVEAIIPDIQEVARLRNLDIIDVHTPFLEFEHNRYFKDGVHPNDDGKQKIAEIFYQTLSQATVMHIPSNKRLPATNTIPFVPRKFIQFPAVLIGEPGKSAMTIDCKGRAPNARP